MLYFGLVLPFIALAVSWPQRTAPSRSPRSANAVEIDNTAEPFVLRLTNENGQLGVQPTNRVVEWDDLQGRHYRATISVKKAVKR